MADKIVYDVENVKTGDRMVGLLPRDIAKKIGISSSWIHQYANKEQTWNETYRFHKHVIPDEGWKAEFEAKWDAARNHLLTGGTKGNDGKGI